MWVSGNYVKFICFFQKVWYINYDEGVICANWVANPCPMDEDVALLFFIKKRVIHICNYSLSLSLFFIISNIFVLSYSLFAFTYCDINSNNLIFTKLFGLGITLMFKNVSKS